ncbi:hypothetical protein Nepgr_028344 [Nepenthes gracilis]|uniref:Uncharacterized protein n=1 Tax=Nepenthes gracilis TaxID=150966 RepID=A0AAD3TCA5_NEPGR|nr:hypothetical protein Nepgr_028344 [Nepenthes gracilis]
MEMPCLPTIIHLMMLEVVIVTHLMGPIWTLNPLLFVDRLVCGPCLHILCGFWGCSLVTETAGCWPLSPPRLRGRVCPCLCGLAVPLAVPLRVHAALHDLVSFLTTIEEECNEELLELFSLPSLLAAEGQVMYSLKLDIFVFILMDADQWEPWMLVAVVSSLILMPASASDAGMLQTPGLYRKAADFLKPLCSSSGKYNACFVDSPVSVCLEGDGDDNAAVAPASIAM